MTALAILFLASLTPATPHAETRIICVWVMGETASEDRLVCEREMVFRQGVRR